LVAGSETRGSRPEGSPRIAIDDAAAYPALLAAHHIIVDLQARRTLVAKGAQELATRVEGVIPDDPDLLAEVTNLVEWPTPFLGHFEEQYLRLPSEVLIAVMRKHQRYFPVRDGEGQLLPHFVGVRNGGDEHMDVVRHGNEAVIRARFADADYFYQQDVQEPLETYVSRLDTLTFQEQLGSMLDKTRRLEALVPWLAGELGLSDEDGALAQRAAHLCKADLATQMVVELTSLQGLMGREYALKAGEPPQVADAIFEHYLPRSAGDDMPQSRIGLLLGVANRLDSLVGLFAVGLKPTGSADPYHLRRDALGLVESLIAHRVSFSVADGLEHAGRKLPVDVDGADVLDAVDFVVERLRGYLRDRGFAYDVVDAVLAARGADPYRAFEAVQALSRWVDREDWELILDNYARCVRITRDVEGDLSLDPEVFEQTAETALYEAYLQARDQVTPESTVDEFFNAFLPLVDRIDHYFARESGVMVMAEDRRLRQNRLAQLHQIAELASGIVDLSRLEGF
jgi:glycyl-tRNA synthetase